MAILISALISDPCRWYRPRALARGRYHRQGPIWGLILKLPCDNLFIILILILILITKLWTTILITLHRIVSHHITTVIHIRKPWTLLTAVVVGIHRKRAVNPTDVTFGDAAVFFSIGQIHEWTLVFDLAHFCGFLVVDILGPGIIAPFRTHAQAAVVVFICPCFIRDHG